MAELIWSRDHRRPRRDRSRSHSHSRTRQPMRPAVSVMLPPPITNRTPPRTIVTTRRARSPHVPAPIRTQDDALAGADGISEPMLFDMSPVVSHRRIDTTDSGSPPYRPAYTLPPPLLPKVHSFTSTAAAPRIPRGAPLVPPAMLQQQRGSLEPAADVAGWVRGTTSAGKAPKEAPPAHASAAAPRQLFRYQLPLPPKGGQQHASGSRLGANVHRRPVGLGDSDGEVPDLVHGSSPAPCWQCLPSERAGAGQMYTVEGPNGFTRRRRSTPDNFTLELEAMAALRQQQQQHAQHSQHQQQQHSQVPIESSSEDDVLVTPSRANSRQHASPEADDELKHAGSGGGSGDSSSRITYRASTHSPQPIVRGRNRSARPLGRTSIPGQVVQQMARLELDSPGSSMEEAREDDRLEFRSGRHVRRRPFE